MGSHWGQADSLALCCPHDGLVQEELRGWREGEGRGEARGGGGGLVGVMLSSASVSLMSFTFS